jgi:hypothetical protein
VKLRIIQDHNSYIQPWFRLEEFKLDYWNLVDSGSNLDRMRDRMRHMAETPVTPNITVIEEIEK